MVVCRSNAGTSSGGCSRSRVSSPRSSLRRSWERCFSRSPLWPLRRELVARGWTPRIASAAASLNRRTRETLSAVAAILQFVPVVGPSVLLAALAGYHLAVGELLRAVLVATVGGVVIALLPDVLIRPRLARRTADIPGSLYFVGFFGGVLTLGPIGVVAGPLAVGLFVEVATLLSAELNPPAVGSRPTIRPIPTLPTPVILTETCNLSMSAPAPR